MDYTVKIGSLLAKAEGTDNEAEREAYIAKAQQLATQYAIDLEVARLAAGGQARKETPEARRVSLFDWHDKSKTRPYFCNLFMAIGKANNIHFLIDSNSRYVVAHGFASDIDLTQQMFNSISLQMVSAANKYLASGEYKNTETFYSDSYGYGQYKPTHGQTARRSFYDGFNATIGQRCREAVREAESQTVTVNGEQSTGALVLVPRKDEVAKFYAEVPRGRGSWRGAGGSTSSSARGAGAEAGRSASLGRSAGVSGGRTAVNA